MQTEEVKKEKVSRYFQDEFEQRLFSKKKEDLEDYWHFQWDNNLPVQWNIYKFFDALEVYRFFCRQWEEKHNGSFYIVERIREQYLLPKIKEFLETLRALDN